MAEHKDLPAGEIHVPHQWKFETAAQREAFATTDVRNLDRLALQNDDSSYWRLVSIQPSAWRAVAISEGQLDTKVAQAQGFANAAESFAEASQSAATDAAAQLTSFYSFYYGSAAVDPTTNPYDGSALRIGGFYLNTSNTPGVMGFRVYRGGGQWETPDVDATAIAAEGGAALVGFDGTTVQAALLKPMQDYATLRAYAGSRASAVRLTKQTIAGDFYVDLADTTTADDGWTVVVDAIGRRWKRRFEGAKNLRWADIKGDGSDEYNALQRAFTIGGAISIPPGFVFGTSQEIKVGSNLTVWNLGSWFDWLSNTLPLGRAAIFKVIRKSRDLIFDSMWFKNSSTADNVAGIAVDAAINVRVYKPKARECAAVYAYPSLAGGGSISYAQVITDPTDPNFNCPADIHVTDPDVIGRGANRHFAAIEMVYVQEWSVIGGTAKDIIFGVQWWGGDSNHESDGAVANERKCSGGMVLGFSSTWGHAGVWGSMMEGGKVSACHAGYHTDVGIDPEGCNSTLIEGNTAEHCLNGCFAGFFFNRDVVFRGNTAFQDGSWGGILFKSYNSSNAPVPVYTVESNTFVYKGPNLGVVYLDPGMSIMRFLNNDMRDSIIQGASNNMGVGTWDGNKLHYTKTIPSNTTLITLGSNHGRWLEILGTTVTSDVIQTDPTVTVFLTYQADFNNTVPTRLHRNRVYNFGGPASFKYANESGNGGVRNPFLYYDNTFDGAITDVSSLPNRTVTRQKRNDNFFGTPYPDLEVL